jgi:hypothetical protein
MARGARHRRHGDEPVLLGNAPDARRVSCSRAALRLDSRLNSVQWSPTRPFPVPTFPRAICRAEAAIRVGGTGPAQPAISFTSTPALPGDELLSRLCSAPRSRIVGAEAFAAG